MRLTEPMKISRLLLVLVLLSGGAAFQAQASLDSRLIDAAEAGEAAEVSKLLSAGASVNAHSPIGKTALMFAAQEGHLEARRSCWTTVLISRPRPAAAARHCSGRRSAA